MLSVLPLAVLVVFILWAPFVGIKSGGVGGLSVTSSSSVVANGASGSLFNLNVPDQTIGSSSVLEVVTKVC